MLDSELIEELRLQPIMELRGSGEVMQEQGIVAFILLLEVALSITERSGVCGCCWLSFSRIGSCRNCSWPKGAESIQIGRRAEGEATSDQ